ncbi:MAG: EAL domain-containing protein [Paracoccaceae bacterium]
MGRKKSFGNRLEEVGNPLDSAVANRDGSILQMVSAAVRHGEVRLAFQPVMQARNDGVVAFYESLLRVLDATGRVIPAGQFMPKVETEELGRELDCAALKQGLHTLTQFRDLRLSVNMSARSIGYRKWMRILDKFLTQDPSLGERLILEISEKSAMSMPDIVTGFMADMQARGIAFALDDYGSGSIAIRHFREFLFDAVKIHGQFVRGISGEPANQLLVGALIKVAREFDMFTVATSVESAADAAFLVQVGADCLQGFQFGAPSMTPPWLPDRAARETA